jgi:hypothetical protein
VSWEVLPELGERDVEAALLAAVEEALAEDEGDSVWWRSGLDDLGGGPAPKQPWGDAGVIET